MAAKAKARREAIAEENAEYWREIHEAERERDIAAYAASLTVEEAQAEEDWAKENPIGCCCTGGPRCCQIRYEARKRVLGL